MSALSRDTEKSSFISSNDFVQLGNYNDSFKKILQMNEFNSIRKLKEEKNTRDLKTPPSDGIKSLEHIKK
jgi:hypothetical protein